MSVRRAAPATPRAHRLGFVAPLPQSTPALAWVSVYDVMGATG
jgi:hypothetical protein